MGLSDKPSSLFSNVMSYFQPTLQKLHALGLSQVDQYSSQHSDLFGRFCMTRRRCLLGWFDFIFLSIHKLFSPAQFLPFPGNKGTPSDSTILKFLCWSYWSSCPICLFMDGRSPPGFERVCLNLSRVLDCGRCWARSDEGMSGISARLLLFVVFNQS